MSRAHRLSGEPGANGDEACRLYFPDLEPTPYAAFEDAFEAVRRGDCTLALIPVENSIAGRVADVHHLLPSSGLRIIGERFKPIRFQLMANPGVRLEDVRTVVSMPIALGQCRRALRKLGVRTEPSGDTAGAAKALAERPDATKAAIAPALAAKLYGVAILMTDIEDEAHNTTRFLVMSADPNPPSPAAGAPTVTSFTFRVRNIPAALYKALGGFATNGVNMTKLESYMENWRLHRDLLLLRGRRPAGGNRRWAARWEELGFFSDHLEVLGVYEADPFRKRT